MTKDLKDIKEYEVIGYGFNEKQERIFAQSLGDCGQEDATNNKKYQDENIAVMKMILDMDNIDYLIKLYNIKVLIDTNIALKNYMKSFK